VAIEAPLQQPQRQIAVEVGETYSARQLQIGICKVRRHENIAPTHIEGARFP
jgi:hypothetical protein